MRLVLFERESSQEPIELTTADHKWLTTACPGPLELPFLQSSIVEPKPIMFPVQDFELVASAIAEDKPAVRKRIGFELTAHNSRQAIYRLSHIGYALGKIHAFGIDTA